MRISIFSFTYCIPNLWRPALYMNHCPSSQLNLSAKNIYDEHYYMYLYFSKEYYILLIGFIIYIIIIMTILGSSNVMKLNQFLFNKFRVQDLYITKTKISCIPFSYASIHIWQNKSRTKFISNLNHTKNS